MTPHWYQRPLGPGASGPDVETVQRLLHGWQTGTYDVETAARVRALQRRHGLDVTGVVSDVEAAVLGESLRYGLTPDWYERPVGLGDHCESVATLRYLLGLPDGECFDVAVDAAVRRFQSAHGLTPTGKVNADVANLLGDDVPWRQT